MTTEIKELSLPLPYTPHTTAHIHLTRHQTCTTVFLTSSTPGDAAGSIKPMGSFVYAMPDVRSNIPFSTSTYHQFCLLVIYMSHVQFPTTYTYYPSLSSPSSSTTY